MAWVKMKFLFHLESGICKSIYVFRGFELFYGNYYGVAEGGLGLSVLRTFRLLRIIKLVRYSYKERLYK